MGGKRGGGGRGVEGQGEERVCSIASHRKKKACSWRVEKSTRNVSYRDDETRTCALERKDERIGGRGGGDA